MGAMGLRLRLDPTDGASRAFSCSRRVPLKRSVQGEGLVPGHARLRRKDGAYGFSRRHSGFSSIPTALRGCHAASANPSPGSGCRKHSTGGDKPMMQDDEADARPSGRQVWNAVCEELREVAWLASVIGGLSAAGVGLAIALAAA